ncbi:hypothetical protein GN956_G4859 [Arapaima gigas]
MSVFLQDPLSCQWLKSTVQVAPRGPVSRLPCADCQLRFHRQRFCSPRLSERRTLAGKANIVQHYENFDPKRLQMHPENERSCSTTAAWTPSGLSISPSSTARPFSSPQLPFRLSVTLVHPF